MKTLKDLKTLEMVEVLKDNRMIHGECIPIEYLREFAKEHIKYLRKQEKLHWEWVNHSMGEHPTCDIPKGFNRANGCGLPYGYKTVIRWIQKTFDLEVDKDEKP